MIIFQGKAKYAGAAAAAPIKTVALEFAVTHYTYIKDRAGVVRTDPDDVRSWRVAHVLSEATYSTTPGLMALGADDDDQEKLAWIYFGTAALEGDLDRLSVPVSVRFLTEDSVDLGSPASFSALCLPIATESTAVVARMPVERGDYVVVNRTAFEAVHAKLSKGGIALSGAQLLTIIARFTVIREGRPGISDLSAENLRGLEGSGGRSISAARLAKIFNESKSDLLEFSLRVPDIRTLAIAGSLTVEIGGVKAQLPDLQMFELAAEVVYDGDRFRRLSHRIPDGTPVDKGKAAFKLIDGQGIVGNGLKDPVRVWVRGPDGAVAWSKEYGATDAVLSALDIQVSVKAPIELEAVPADADPDRTKRLRGQIVTYVRDCTLKDALVIVEARMAADLPWRVVASAMTDGTGRFTMPYPYGVYTAARATVSLSPAESADIEIKEIGPNATLSDDFLYLLLKDPRCQANETKDCECESADAANRLPDHADLIASDVYTQDIGAGCVNLSKPNRTISEYAFSAIVRISDPDVATYALTRHEAGLDGIDVSLRTSLGSAVAGMSAATGAALTKAQESFDGNPTVSASRTLEALKAAQAHVNVLSTGLQSAATPVTLTVLADAQTRAEAVLAILQGYRDRAIADDFPHASVEPTMGFIPGLRRLIDLAIDAVGTTARYELTRSPTARQRRPIGFDNPVLWQDAPEPAEQTGGGAAGGVGLRVSLDALRAGKFGGVKFNSARQEGLATATIAQSVSVATGHILHYKAVVKADGYSMGELLYSLPLAPGQKKEIVVFDSTHALTGAESQTLSQSEQLAMSLLNERDITDQLTGNLSESMRGSSVADTRGISAGLGSGVQGSGGANGMSASGGLVIGVAGGWAQASSNAQQNSSRDVAQFFGEKLRQSIMQNADSYRRLNASVITTVQEGQRYGVTSEVVANHNRCHALTIMYFEVLRHFAVFQELASAEECVFVPLLLTRFTTENVGKWRDVLAPALLPLHSDTYIQPSARLPQTGRLHPLLKAFDADERIRTHYANVDFPSGSYDEEPIRMLKGTMRLRVSLPRPRTRYDRILSFPIVRTLDLAALGDAAQKYALDMHKYATKAAITLGISMAFDTPPSAPNPAEFEVLKRVAIADAFMQIDANYESVPPAQCVRIVDFKPKGLRVGGFDLTPNIAKEIDFFAENAEDKDQWTQYALLMGYSGPAELLNAHFRGNLISEWDEIFQKDILPVVFEKILDAISLDHFRLDLSSATKYGGGERLLPISVSGQTSRTRRQLPDTLQLKASHDALNRLKNYVTLRVEDMRLDYATAHYNGPLFSGQVGDDLLDGCSLYIPENADEKRNPRRDDRYLSSKLIEHLNAHLEYYNKVLWFNLDPDRRFMLLDGFSIQVFDDQGRPVTGPDGMRSLASVVKNEVVAVTGNSLVLPVAPGYRVSGAFIRAQVAGGADPEEVSLFDHYRPLTPVPPYRISVPSKGVFAEAVQGACNACEKIEHDRLQDWARFPLADAPPSINPVTVPTPTLSDWRANYKDFAAPIVNVQNVPATPAPGAGLAGLSDLLGKSGMFKDITGLDANQQNAIRTYLSNQENAKAFAEMAKEMAMQQHNTDNSSRIMDSIATAKQAGDLSKEDAGKLVRDHLQHQIDGGEEKKAERETKRQSTPSPLTQAAVDAASQGRTVKAQSPVGNEGGIESIDIGDPQLIGANVLGMPNVVEAVAGVAGTVFGIARAVNGDALVGDPNGDVDLSAAVIEHLKTLANCGNGPCVNVSASYFAQAMKAKGVPMKRLSTDGGPVEMPVVASANGESVSARALLILWFSNSTDATWSRLPKACRGAGAPGALLYADLVAGRAIINSETEWPAGMVPGALLQLWSSKAEYEALRDNGEVPGLGHSCVFVDYDAADNTRIIVADQMGLEHSIKYPYLGLAFVMAANLSNGKIVSFA